MNRISVTPLLEAEDIIEENLLTYDYAGNPSAKKITHGLKAIQQTIQQVLLRVSKTETWHPGISFPNPILFEAYEFGQIKWASQSAYTILQLVKATPTFPQSVLSDLESVHEMLSVVAENKVNIVPLLDAQPLLKVIFGESKEMDLKDRSTVQMIRKLLFVSREIEDMMYEYLPLEYILDATFEEFNDEKVIAPTSVLAPGGTIFTELNIIKCELLEINAIQSVDGIELSEKMSLYLMKLNKLVDMVLT